MTGGSKNKADSIAEAPQNVKKMYSVSIFSFKYVLMAVMLLGSCEVVI